jgi:hypothetical protein
MVIHTWLSLEIIFCFGDDRFGNYNNYFGSAHYGI